LGVFLCSVVAIAGDHEGWSLVMRLLWVSEEAGEVLTLAAVCCEMKVSRHK